MSINSEKQPPLLLRRARSGVRKHFVPRILATAIALSGGIAGCVPETNGGNTGNPSPTSESINLGDKQEYVNAETQARIDAFKKAEFARRLELAQAIDKAIREQGLNISGVYPFDLEKEMHLKVDTGQEGKPVNFRTFPDLSSDSTLFARDDTHVAAGLFEGFPNGSRTPETEVYVKLNLAPEDEATFAVFRLSDVDAQVGGNLESMARGPIMKIDDESYILACISRGQPGQIMSYMQEDSVPVDWNQKVQ